jgi:hypothetical protein
VGTVASSVVVVIVIVEVGPVAGVATRSRGRQLGRRAVGAAQGPVEPGGVEPVDQVLQRPLGRGVDVGTAEQASVDEVDGELPPVSWRAPLCGLV